MDSDSLNLLSLEKSQWLILAPQGAEYQAVLKGIKNIPSAPIILSIPIGTLAVTNYLQDWLQSRDYYYPIKGVILMGLAGSLSMELGLGEIALFESCLNFYNGQAGEIHQSDGGLIHWVQQKLGKDIRLIQGLTSDRVITNALEKQALGKHFNCQAVEMEGWAVLNFFNKLEIPAAIVRVISDEADQSLPDLNGIYDAQGKLNGIALTIALFKEPIAGLNLIRGSLRALRRLEQLSRDLSVNLTNDEDFG